MDPSPTYRGRFAPSPTGPLHFGSLVAALGSWLFARHHGGEWLVRIEDLDPPREVPGAARAQLATLAAFGLEADQPPVFQSERGALYAAALEGLLARGEAFECRCSRSELEAAGGIHRACVGRGAGRTPAIRLRVPDETLVFEDRIQGHFEQALAREVGDFVLRRADGFWAYQLAVVVDDGAQGITDVVRGADLLDSTPRQLLLQRRLGLPTPGYAHLPLVLDAGGRKLGKSLAALPVDPADPGPALAAAWSFLGQDAARWPAALPAAKALERALPAFEPARIPRRAAPPDEGAVTKP
ncbi:tRNA glutamyl-Q(34) synthetase GluQRS [bacterium BD-1]|nr:tRNA glutamyl-Q(34) synthetase GluQRS [Ottowia caeni]